MGLLLEQPVFDSYNNKIANINEKLEPSDPNFRPPIDFELYRESIETFKQQHIYTQMRAVEDRDAMSVIHSQDTHRFVDVVMNSFDAWIRSVDNYTGNDLLYLNAKGVIPTEAVITKGERREKPFREKRRFDAAGFSGNLGSKAEEDEEEVDEELRGALAETEG
jgi:tRNA pseudouridine38-40 synthase